MEQTANDHAKRLLELSVDSEAQKRLRAAADDDVPKRSCIIGRPAPGFQAAAVLGDGTLGSVSLEDYCGRYLLLLFYPADYTFVCPTELAGFGDRASELAALGCDLLACSTDSQFVHHNWRLQPRHEGGVRGIAVPMLADTTRAISRSYGVLCEEAGVAFRGLFLIDRAQVLRVAIVNDLPVGRSVDEALRLVQALRHTDEHGEVCPAGWRPGAPAIVPSIAELKRFFRE
ncbi:Peroxiredoxin-2 [Coemansia helicoidea]|uniref:Peroxiredoxin-2 n=1 Tax=Coemansia helicoidea TaxID=1286919 RepID=A0ACC1KWD6_9FUNG|nr:Peroxiredoxin-2 [Coemansia helicoidea]